MSRRSTKSLFYAAALVGGTLLQTAPAYAQATRTWVSGVGDDANPCSRTAPCKTFAGAISKTAAGGEINCIDPGGFGAVTITKSITIDCHYTEGGVLASGNGIIINAAATDIVTLRGLDIFGVNPPSNGVRFLVAAALHIEDCVIRRFNAASSAGVSFQPSGASSLYLTNVTIMANGNGSTGGGILVQPTGLGSASVNLRHVNILDNAGNGFRIDTTGNTGAGIKVTIEDSDVAGNGNGVVLNVPAGTTTATVMLHDVNISNQSGIGILASGGGAKVRVGGSTITGNATGLAFGNSAIVNSYGDNRLDGNGTDGAFTAPAIPPK